MTPVARERLLIASVLVGIVVYDVLIFALFAWAGQVDALLVLLGTTLLCVARVGWWLHRYDERWRRQLRLRVARHDEDAQQ